MKTALAVVLLAPILVSCSSTGSFSTAKQRDFERRYVTCSLETSTPSECTQRAIDLCGSKDYEVVDPQGLPSSITDKDARIRCKVQSGNAPLGS